jgi:hypothetical protein
MPTIQDKEISKTYEKVVEGKGTFSNFYLVGGAKKFSLFVTKGKTIPKSGMRVALLEWEEVQEGEYLNNKVKNIVWMGASEQATGKSTTASAGDRNSPIYFCLSYAKDLQVALIAAGKAKDGDLMQLGLETAMVAIDMLRFIQNPADLVPKEKPKEPEAQEPGILDEQIPF